MSKSKSTSLIGEKIHEKKLQPREINQLAEYNTTKLAISMTTVIDLVPFLRTSVLISTLALSITATLSDGHPGSLHRLLKVSLLMSAGTIF